MRKYIQLISRPAIARDPGQSLILDSTPWILASVEIGFHIPFFWWDYVFLELYSGFQSPGFLIPHAKNSQISESRFPHMKR